MKTPDTFFDKVYRIAKKIPYGRVTSYGAIAEYIGTRGSARMVGWAMNASHTQTGNIPAHRVVNRNGVLTGKHHFGGPKVMQQLLESEGIEVAGDQIIHFDKVFWDPQKELTSTQKRKNITTQTTLTTQTTQTTPTTPKRSTTSTTLAKKKKP